MRAISQCAGRGSRLDEYPQPAKRICPRKDGMWGCRNRRAAHTVKSIAASNEVALNIQGGVTLLTADAGFFSLYITDTGVAHLKKQSLFLFQPGGNQILNHLM